MLLDAEKELTCKNKLPGDGKRPIAGLAQFAILLGPIFNKLYGLIRSSNLLLLNVWHVLFYVP